MSLLDFYRNPFMIGLVLVFILSTSEPPLASPEIPGEEQNRPIALIGGSIHPVSGPVMLEGVLIFDQGKITAVGHNINIPDSAVRVDVTGKHVYPGLFDAYTNIGLVEINAVRATRDYSESGTLNPNARAQVAINPDSELIPVTRSNGVLLALTAPSSGLISGKSAVVQMDGWTWEDMTLRAEVSLNVHWPAMSSTSSWFVEESAKEQIEASDKALQQLRQAFEDALAYRKARTTNGTNQARDARWEAMLPVLSGKLPMLVAADDIQQIEAAVAFADRHGARLIIYGGYDAPYCVGLLKKHKVPVIVAGVYRIPRRRSDNYDDPYTLPARLFKAGIQFCIASSGRFGASNTRNLPYHAATATAYGLPQEEALKSITLYPAEILGIAEQVGSLDVGKDATLIITTGDPLEIPTQVKSAFVQGRQIDLNNRHKRLWKKYQEKYRRQDARRNQRAPSS